MNLDFHNMPSQHAILENAIKNLENSNEKLQRSNEKLQRSNEKLQQELNASVSHLEQTVLNQAKQIEELTNRLTTI